MLRLAAAEGEPSRVCEPSPPRAEVEPEAGPRVGAPSIVCDRPLGTLPHYDYLRPEAAPDGVAAPSSSRSWLHEAAGVAHTAATVRQ